MSDRMFNDELSVLVHSIMERVVDRDILRLCEHTLNSMPVETTCLSFKTCAKCSFKCSNRTKHCKNCGNEFILKRNKRKRAETRPVVEIDYSLCCAYCKEDLCESTDKCDLGCGHRYHKDCLNIVLQEWNLRCCLVCKQEIPSQFLQ